MEIERRRKASLVCRSGYCSGDGIFLQRRRRKGKDAQANLFRSRLQRQPLCLREGEGEREAYAGARDAKCRRSAKGLMEFSILRPTRGCRTRLGHGGCWCRAIGESARDCVDVRATTGARDTEAAVTQTGARGTTAAAAVAGADASCRSPAGEGREFRSRNRESTQREGERERVSERGRSATRKELRQQRAHQQPQQQVHASPQQIPSDDRTTAATASFLLHAS